MYPPITYVTTDSSVSFANISIAFHTGKSGHGEEAGEELHSIREL